MYNSQYYTCEQIDERLLQGYLDDYNTQTGQSLTKAQFLTKLGSIFSKEGVIDNTATQIGYYECDTAAGTAAKTITVANYALFAGGSMKVKFANKNTANNATLNINSQGAKALYYQGERASATNSWDAEEVVEIYYDGTSYYANNVKGGSGSGVYDVSKEHPTSGPNSDGKFTLEYILNSSNVNELIPVNKRYPGMTIQFVSTSDNKYVQYLCNAQTFTNNVAYWEKTNLINQLSYYNVTDNEQVNKIIKALYIDLGTSGVSKADVKFKTLYNTGNEYQVVIDINGQATAFDKYSPQGKPYYFHVQKNGITLYALIDWDAYTSAVTLNPLGNISDFCFNPLFFPQKEIDLIPKIDASPIDDYIVNVNGERYLFPKGAYITASKTISSTGYVGIWNLNTNYGSIVAFRIKSKSITNDVIMGVVVDGVTKTITMTENYQFIKGDSITNLFCYISNATTSGDVSIEVVWSEYARLHEKISIEEKKISIEEKAQEFGLSVNIVKNLLFIGKFPSVINENTQYVIANKVGLGSLQLSKWENTPAYLSVRDAIPNISQNTEIIWERDISYSDLYTYDYDNIFVRYDDEAPYTIEEVAILKSSAVLSDDDKVLLYQRYRLPIFRDNILIGEGVLKHNRGFRKSLYQNLVAAPSFTGDTSLWHCGDTWVINNGSAVCNDENASQQSLTQNIATSLVVGAKYKIVYKVEGRTSGSIQVRIDWDTLEGKFVSLNAFVEETFIYKTPVYPTHTNEIMFRPGDTGFVGKIKLVELSRIY